MGLISMENCLMRVVLSTLGFIILQAYRKRKVISLEFEVSCVAKH